MSFNNFIWLFLPYLIGTDSGMCSNVKIYSRATWGARHPKSVTTMHTPASLFFVHHTEGNFCHDFTSCAAQARGIQNYHMDSRGIEKNLHHSVKAIRAVFLEFYYAEKIC